MTSRLLNRLEADIRGAAHPVAADCLRCERAAYLARLGHFDEASRELGAVQRRHETRPSAAISAWVSLADALVSHYSDMGPLAADKLKRAHALSAAAGLAPLQALSAAWLAHLAYLRMDAASVARHAAEALRLAMPDHHAARARATLVIAQAYDEGGRLDLARPWYEQARRHAGSEGDDTLLSAMMWNMASLRVAALRQARAGGQRLEAGAGERALRSAESTASYDDMLGVRSLRSLQPILRAQVCALLGQHAEALPLFEAHLAESMKQGMGSVEATLLADRAWCRLQTGETAGARADAASAEVCLQRDSAFGDRAPAHSRLAELYRDLGDAQDASRHDALAGLAWAGHAGDQAQLVDALNREFAPTAA